MMRKTKTILAIAFVAFCLMPIFGIVENSQAYSTKIQTKYTYMDIYSQVLGYDFTVKTELWYDTVSKLHWVEIKANSAALINLYGILKPDLTDFRAFLGYHTGLQSNGRFLYTVFDEFQHVKWKTYQFSWNDCSQLGLNGKKFDGRVIRLASGSFSATGTPQKQDYIEFINFASPGSYYTRVNFVFKSDTFKWSSVVQRSQYSVGFYLWNQYDKATIGNVYLTTTHP